MRLNWPLKWTMKRKKMILKWLMKLTMKGGTKPKHLSLYIKKAEGRRYIKPKYTQDLIRAPHTLESSRLLRFKIHTQTRGTFI